MWIFSTIAIHNKWTVTPFELNGNRFRWCDCKQYPCIILDVSIKTTQRLMFINKYWPFLYHTRSNNIQTTKKKSNIFLPASFVLFGRHILLIQFKKNESKRNYSELHWFFWAIKFFECIIVLETEANHFYSFNVEFILLHSQLMKMFPHTS